MSINDDKLMVAFRNGIWISVMIWAVILFAVLLCNGCAPMPKKKCTWVCEPSHSMPDCHFYCDGDEL